MVLERPKAQQKIYGNLKYTFLDPIAVPDKEHRTTRERLAAFYGKTSAVTSCSGEVEWGKPMGKEVW
jgi:hypothetical protein